MTRQCPCRCRRRWGVAEQLECVVVASGVPLGVTSWRWRGRGSERAHGRGGSSTVRDGQLGNNMFALPRLGRAAK
jgi:hypothetical protein